MLDDLKMIHERDAQDALGVAEKQWQQLTHKYEVPNNTALPKVSEVKNIILAGMGGSALPGVFIQSWPGLSVPFEVVRGYNLPNYVDSGTLVISSSHSGNTEETLSALEEAAGKGAKIVVVAAGGKLLEAAQAKNYPLLVIPTGTQPRMSSFYFLAAFAQIFTMIGLCKSDILLELEQVSAWLKGQVTAWRPDTAAKDNQAKQIAQELMGRTAIVYSGPKLFPAANKWKICINENAKNLAWCNQYSEFNHNEFMGWTSHPVDKPFAVVEIRSNLEHPRIQKRFEVSEKLLSGKRPAPIVVIPEGDTLLQQLLWTSCLGDFASIYLALLNNVNPTPVDLVEKLKLALDA